MMPLSLEDFPYEVQVAFFVYSLLSDKYDSMGGHFLGKDWSECEHLFKLYGVLNQEWVMYFMKVYERIHVEHLLSVREAKEKAAKAKAPTSGKGRVVISSDMRPKKNG